MADSNLYARSMLGWYNHRGVCTYVDHACMHTREFASRHICLFYVHHSVISLTLPPKKTKVKREANAYTKNIFTHI